MLACEVEFKQGVNKGQLTTGTRGGYERHLKANEPACEPCLKANRDRHRAFRKANAGRMAEYDRAYREANRERLRAQSRAYNAAHREELRERARAYYYANAEYFQAWREANRDRIAAWSRAHYEANREKYRQKNARRRARLRGVESDDYTLSEIYERDRGRCQLCGKNVNLKWQWPDRRSPSIDHLIPLEHGGSDTRVNVQLTHVGCNAGKQARTIPTGEQLRLVG